jgi:predicted ATP-grasp superfamily ATP-dependent carboligase
MGNPFRQRTGSKAILLKSFLEQDERHVFELLAPEDVIVQRLIETDRPVLSVCSLSIEGRAIGLFQYEKLRQHPNRFGTGTYLRSVKIDALTTLAQQILGSLRYTGISEIEFIYDPETRCYKVIEMNPRTWKSIHFSTLCGQNLVAKYLSSSLREPMAASLDYEVGRYWADLATDVPQMFRERKLFSYHKGYFECAWDRTDPRPALALWTLWPLIAMEQCLDKLGKWVTH